ncbi:hypothetical protein DPMN_057437 [Dreissena polymorpha]|uniref:Uncharacterized protein n=1 Tax=Dreissena polymorpha TaxID=45954 RepID=A0A9D4HEA6_DREPO|nr:hypothetical protein DPMN_057437 [Dreissena polymorpha]
MYGYLFSSVLPSISTESIWKIVVVFSHEKAHTFRMQDGHHVSHDCRNPTQAAHNRKNNITKRKLTTK